MSQNGVPDQNEIGNIFFQDGFSMAKEHLAEGVTETNLIRLLSTAYEAVDGLIVSFRNRCLREGLTIGCQKGCAWCCHQAVLASTQEILLITRYLTRNLTAGQQQVIQRNARDRQEVTGSMTVKEFLQTLHPCPFLIDDSCLIYPVRPMACRCYLSAEVESCLAQFRHPESNGIMAALYDLPLLAGRSINEGIRAVLMQNRIITSEWLLEVFITRTFDNNGIFDEWLSGKDPFGIRALSAEENEYLRKYKDGQESFQ